MFSRRNLTLLIGTAILSLAVVIGAMPAETELPAPERAGTSRVVRVDHVEATPASREVRVAGVTRSAQRAALAFTVPARLLSRPVEVGDRVRAGDVIARLDDREFALANRTAEAALAELDVRLAQARRDEARVMQLADAKAATAEELERTQAGTASLSAARDASAARVDDTRRLLAETTLRAPFAGTVTSVKKEAGEWVSPGSTVVELSGSESVEVRIEVPESVRAGISSGARVRVALPMSGITTEGTVTAISDTAAGAGALFPVIVSLDETDAVVSGLAAEVSLPLAIENELTVPLAAVLDSGSSRPTVFVVDGDIARRVAVRPGRVIGDRLTVTSDELEAGARVAVLGHTALVDGDRVEVR